MDFDIWRLAVDAVQLALTCAVGVYAWVATKHRATLREIKELDTRLDAVEHRVTVAEEQLKSTPTDKAIHELAIAIEHLVGDFKAHAARLDGLGEIVKRLESVAARQEQFLLEHGRPAR